MRRWKLAVLCALAIHATLVALAIWSVKITGPPQDSRAVIIDLITLATPQRARARPAKRQSVFSMSPVEMPKPASPSTPVTAPTASAPSPDYVAANVRALLRGSVGCDSAAFLKLTQEERQRCARWRTTVAAASGELPASIDPTKQASYEASLRRRQIGEVLPSRPAVPSWIVGRCGGAIPLPDSVKVGPCRIGIPGIFNSDDASPP